MQVDVVGEGTGDGVGGDEVVGGAVLVGSLQPPNQPGCRQLGLAVDVGEGEVVVIVGAGAGAGVLDERELSVEVEVILSLQPNQPGVLHVEVELVDVDVFECVVVSGSSKQPHQPGVLHVSVLVREDADVLVTKVEDVEDDGSVPLLSKNDQGKQSVQSTYCSHLAGSSYCSKTSLITFMIL